MSNNKTGSSNFLIQGSILAVAGILVRIIGLIYRIPLNNILGEEGVGYYSTAYNIYSILLLLSSQSMPIAVSKLVSERISKEQYTNSKRVFVGALWYAVIIGSTVGLIAYFGSDYLASIYELPACARALRVLAPTLVIVSIIGVFRGYFQGMGDVIPTSVSQLLEQIVNAVVSVVAAYELYSFGKMAEASNDLQRNTNAASYSAAGGTLGTCLGAFTAFLVLLYIYIKKRKDIDDIIRKESVAKERYLTISKILVLTITPILFSTTIYQAGNLIDTAIYGKVMAKFFDYPERIISTYGGIYSNYKLLTTMPMAIASALTLSLVPAVVASFKTQKMDEVKTKIDMAFKFTMIISFPCGVGLSVVGGPAYMLLFFKNTSTITIMMLFSAFTVVFFSVSTISNSILQSIDKLRIPIISSGISLAIHIVLLPLMLIVFKWNIYAVIIGDFLFALGICILNSIALKKAINYRMDYKDVMLKPLISSVIMGICAFLIYFGINQALLLILGNSRRLFVIVSNDVAVIIAIIVAIPLYFISLIKTGGLNESQLKGFPKGTMIVRICKKIRIL